MVKLLIIVLSMALGACAGPDLSTPEGRYRDARMRAVMAGIAADAGTTPSPRLMVCTPIGAYLSCQ